MNYLEVKIDTSAAGLEVLEAVLDEWDITDFVIQDPRDVQEFLQKKNVYDWDYVDESVLQLGQAETSLTFYLDVNEEAKIKLAAIGQKVEQMRKQDQDRTLGGLGMEVTQVCDADWKDKWKEYFKPAHLTERIVVKPSWEAYQKESEEELIIEIDPGMAFGTGTHPTTTLCVRLLEKYMEGPEDVVLDVGCGSGILSMAAALLGAQTVKGVEIDPIAVDVARENVELNQLTKQIQVVQGDLTKGLDWKADIVVANLMADLVMLLSKDVAKHLKGKSIYISSGILVEKQAQVAKAIGEAGFQILEIAEEGEWCAIAAKKE